MQPRQLALPSKSTGGSLGFKAREVFPLKPSLRDLLEAMLARFERCHARAVDGIEDDGLSGPQAAKPGLEGPVEQDFQEPPTVRVELGLDWLERALLDPVFDAGVGGQLVRRLQVEVPAGARLLVRVLHRLG